MLQVFLEFQRQDTFSHIQGVEVVPVEELTEVIQLAVQG